MTQKNNNQSKNTTTYYQLIVDKSGSMGGAVPATLSTINEQLDAIKRISAEHPNQKILTGITFFDTKLEQLYYQAAAQELKPVTENEYVVGDLTALLDAIGQTIIALESACAAQVAKDEASVVVIIITDGYENASKLFRFEQIKEMISRLEATGLWSFTYLGADLSDISEAQRMGFRQSASRVYRKDDMLRYSKFMEDSLHSYVSEKEVMMSVRKDFFQDAEVDEPDTKE